MKLLFLILTLLAAQTGLAETFAGMRASEFKLNQASQQALQDTQLGSKVIKRAPHIMRAVYDFSLQGGSTGVINLRDPVNLQQPAQLPKGAIIRDCIVDVITAPTSAGTASLALGFGGTSTGLVKASTAIGSYTGLVACIPVGTAATAIKLQNDANVSTSISTANVTAGKFYVIIDYDFSEVN